MEFVLKVVEGPEKGISFTLLDDEIVVGRDPSCGITLSDSKMSRRHAAFKRRNGVYFVEDMKSSNGTRVNGHRIDSVELEEGSQIGLGKTTLLVDIQGTDQPELGEAEPYGLSGTISIDTDALARQWPGEDTIESLRRGKASLEALYRVGRMAHSIREPRELAEQIVDLVFQEFAGVDRGALYSVDEATGDLVCMALRVGEEKMPSSQGPLSHSIAELVMGTAQALLVKDALHDTRFMEGESIHAHRIRSVMCAPLMSQARPVGILYADITRPDRVFNQEELRLLAAIGIQTGSLLENARLYEALSEETAALKAAHRKLKTAGEKLIQSEKLAAIGRLASGIAHDIKTPLSVMLGYTGMLKTKLKQEELSPQDLGKMNSYAEEIEKAVSHGNTLLQNLLKFASPSDPEKSLVDVNGLVEETLGFLQVETSKAGVSVTRELALSPPVVEADRNQLKQVLMNLIVNAVQAMDKEEKTLEVATETVGEDPEKRVRVRLTDNGVGMTDAQRNSAFEPFFTTKESDGGTGLGLSISYSLIHRNDGTIEIESEPGEGSTFTITLPAASSLSDT